MIHDARDCAVNLAAERTRNARDNAYAEWLFYCAALSLFHLIDRITTQLRGSSLPVPRTATLSDESDSSRSFASTTSSTESGGAPDGERSASDDASVGS